MFLLSFLRVWVQVHELSFGPDTNTVTGASLLYIINHPALQFSFQRFQLWIIWPLLWALTVPLHSWILFKLWHSSYLKLCISVTPALWCLASRLKSAWMYLLVIPDFFIFDQVFKCVGDWLQRSSLMSHLILFTSKWPATSECQTKKIFSSLWSWWDDRKALELKFVWGKLEAKGSFSAPSRPALSPLVEMASTSTFLMTFHNGSLSWVLFITKLNAICQSEGDAVYKKQPC